MMNLLRRPFFSADAQDADDNERDVLEEWAERQVEIDLEILDDFRSGLRSIHFRPLLWSSAPPSKAGFYYVRFPGAAEYEAVRVDANFEYGPGLEWAGPLPQPRNI